MLEWTKTVSVPFVWHKSRQKRAVPQTKTESTEAQFPSKVHTLHKDCIGNNRRPKIGSCASSAITNKLLYMYVFTNIHVYITYVLPRQWWRLHLSETFLIGKRQQKSSFNQYIFWNQWFVQNNIILISWRINSGFK